ncbi:MAG: O-antigen ligase family protein [Verrucomicrobiota bacterium]
MDWIVAFLIVAPAFVLYLKHSTWIIDYVVWVTVFNRGIRRWVDWMQGEFNPLSPISLTPLVVSGLVFLMVVHNYSRFPPSFQKIMRLFAWALAIAFAVGLVRNKLAAVYALAEYVAPISIMCVAALAGGNEKILDRWIRSIGWAAVFSCIYGWYQYYTIPPWDAFWVRAVGFEGYLGKLKPTEMVVFSTMAERGPFAGFLSFAVIPMLISSRWRNVTGWGSVALILATVLLTFVRTSLITIILATVLYPLLNRGKNTLRMVVLLCVGAVGANYFLGKLSSERVNKRLQTLNNISEDGSYKGRIIIAQRGLAATMRNPIGTGLGSSGLGGRVNTGTMDSAAEIGDNGYLSIIFSFGWVGAYCFFYAFYLVWARVRAMERAGLRNESLMMFKALFITGAVVLLAGDWLAGPSSAVFFIFTGFAANPKIALDRMKQAAALRARPAIA